MRVYAIWAVLRYALGGGFRGGAGKGASTQRKTLRECATLQRTDSHPASQRTARWPSAIAGKPPELHLGLVMFVILGAATLLKLGLYFFCVRLAGRSDSMVALAEDHLNDVFSNAGAIITAAVASVWCAPRPALSDRPPPQSLRVTRSIRWRRDKASGIAAASPRAAASVSTFPLAAFEWIM